MIVVDSSVWIGHFRSSDTGAVHRLRAIENPDEIIVGDLILLEMLQGARDERHAARIESVLRSFTIEAMLDDGLACEAARHYRALRRKGITVRKTVDLVIGTFCIAGGHVLLHDDRDFEAMAEHLGLKILPNS